MYVFIKDPKGLKTNQQITRNQFYKSLICHIRMKFDTIIYNFPVNEMTKSGTFTCAMHVNFFPQSEVAHYIMLEGGSICDLLLLSQERHLKYLSNSVDEQ